MSRAKLKPGSYYVGDPCYVLQGDTWDRLIEGGGDALPRGDVVEFEGYQIWAHYTEHGDGIYGDGFCVDSGTIGVVPVGLIDDPAGMEFGEVIKCPQGLAVEYEDGKFWIGSIVIDTNFDEDTLAETQP